MIKTFTVVSPVYPIVQPLPVVVLPIIRTSIVILGVLLFRFSQTFHREIVRLRFRALSQYDNASRHF